MKVPSLFTLAAQKLTMVKCDNIDMHPRSMPMQVIEKLVLFMLALPFVNFIDSYGSIKHIREKFSPDAFQKFYMHFYKLLELEPHPETKKRMLAYKEEFINNCIYTTTKNGNENGSFNIVFDFCICSLGFLTGNFSFKKSTFADIFFDSKFCFINIPNLRFPVPILPPHWMIYLPKDVDTSVFPYMPAFEYKREPHVEDNCIDKQFFRRLVGMSEAYVNLRNHETLAYGFELVFREDYLQGLRRQKYYLYIYGMLSVSLARIHIDLNICLGFLEKARQLAHVHSQKLDILFYQQRIFYHHDIYDMESKAFEKIFKAVPMQSHFYKQSFLLHFECFIYKIENYICQAMCYKQYGTQKARQSFYNIIEEIASLLIEKRRFLYKCLSICQRYDNEFQKSLLFIDIYMVCVDKLGERTRHYFVNDKISCFALQLNNDTHFFRYFFNHLINSDFYDAQYFTAEMNTRKSIYCGNARNQHIERWGNTCFTLFLLFEILAGEPSRALTWLDYAKENYKKNHSSRLQVCNMYKYKHIDFKVTKNSLICKPCDIEQLLKTNKKVALYTQLGILSIVQFDKMEFI